MSVNFPLRPHWHRRWFCWKFTLLFYSEHILYINENSAWTVQEVMIFIVLRSFKLFKKVWPILDLWPSCNQIIEQNCIGSTKGKWTFYYNAIKKSRNCPLFFMLHLENFPFDNIWTRPAQDIAKLSSACAMHALKKIAINGYLKSGV